MTGLVAFTVASLVCARADAGCSPRRARCRASAGALLVPGSLAIIGRHRSRRRPRPGDRRVVGPRRRRERDRPVPRRLADRPLSWRWVFLINVPLATAAIASPSVTCPSRARARRRAPRLVGSALAALGLAGSSTRSSRARWRLDRGHRGIGDRRLLALVAFLLVESRIANPMVPLGVFKSLQFSGTNAVTFAVYAALGTVTFLLVVHLQTDLGYSALEAGAALLPITACMLLLSLVPARSRNASGRGGR